MVYIEIKKPHQGDKRSHKHDRYLDQSPMPSHKFHVHNLTLGQYDNLIVTAQGTHFVIIVQS